MPADAARTSERAADGAGGEQALVRFDDVCKVYPAAVPVEALSGASFALEEGSFVSIVGPSGSGKSTMLNLLGLLDRPTRGRITLDGEDVGALPDRELSALRAHRIGFVFQQFLLIEGLTAAENVEQGLVYRGARGRDRVRLARACLERVGLGHRASHRPGELSGGEQQRVAIARGLVGDPAVLLADEPTGNLDSASGQAVLDLLRGLHAEGRTLVLITHDEGVAAQAERRLVLRDGRIHADEALAPGGAR